ncbi:site-specific integrase [Actinosynnema mirum]|uniref:Integrase family protein n=1 Tax=Actinosynnema mirum (strain ATCC 29888 / DSM 43827 / JCM 3225 / NBRC 14064 / NCIMB 13271 / NRRL B-12336 / IMRU 3971 / 101) TaxID=446462 RepID=C6WQ17_ACTMD|nr:site-specific integrase [Actinosynnema mirum]ACU35073.1 integrase family protein [Actinosynnema mirum DSM 43827]
MARPRLPVGTHGEIRCYRLPNGRYRAITNYRDYDGVLRPVERVGGTETNAKNNLRAALRDRARAVVGEEVTDRAKVAAVADMWLRELDESGKATRTKRTYRESWTRDLAEPVGELTVREFTVATAERILRAVRDGAGLGSAKHAKVVLTGVLGLAVRYDAIESNPLREVGELGKSKKAKPVAKRLTEITWAQYVSLRAVLVAADAGERADLVDLVDVLAATGARIGELLALGWARVDTGAGTFKLEGAVIREKGIGLLVQPHTKSAAGMRTIEVPSWAVEIVAKRQAEADSEWVFPTALGGLRDPDNTRKSLRRVLAGTEWEGLHPHAFRHLVATRLDEAGLTARQIADYLGHAQVSMTQDVHMNRKVVGGAAAAALEGLDPTK